MHASQYSLGREGKELSDGGYPFYPIRPSYRAGCGYPHSQQQSVDAGYVPPGSPPSHGSQTVSPYPASGTDVPTYPRCASFQLGISQIVLGILSFICWFMVLHYAQDVWGSQVYYANASPGIWGGLLFIISGSFGIAAARSLTRPQILRFLILSVVGLLISIFYIIWSIFGLIDTDKLGTRCALSDLVENCDEAEKVYTSMVVCLSIACLYFLMTIAAIVISSCGATHEQVPLSQSQRPQSPAWTVSQETESSMASGSHWEEKSEREHEIKSDFRLPRVTLNRDKKFKNTSRVDDRQHKIQGLNIGRERY